MAYLSKRKAFEIFELYKSAELSGDDAKAKELEEKLNNANWKIVHSPEWTIIKETQSTLSSEEKQGLFSSPLFVSPYAGTSNTGKKTWMYVGIGVGVIALIVSTILIARAIKKAKNARA